MDYLDKALADLVFAKETIDREADDTRQNNRSSALRNVSQQVDDAIRDLEEILRNEGY